VNKMRGNPALHLLDRYLGIPAIAILGSARRKRKPPAKIETIGLLRTVAIGDTVLISGVIADLRIAYPEARLIFFAGPSNFEIARMLDGIDRVVRVPVSNPLAGLCAVRSIPVDVIFDFGQWPRLESLLALFSRASFTVGFQTANQRRHYGYDMCVEHSSEVHEIQNFRRLVEVLGVRTGSGPFLKRPPSGSGAVEKYIVLHLWPGGRRKKLKQWPSERWVQLIEEFAGWGLEVLLAGAKSDRSSNDAIMGRVKHSAQRFVRNKAGASLEETAAILADACLVVSVDSGVMHMADALGVPLVALHGPSSSKRWGPLSANAIAIDSPLKGCGYISLGWEKVSPPPKCMECVRYETVRDACREILEMEFQSMRFDAKTRSRISAAN